MIPRTARPAEDVDAATAAVLGAYEQLTRAVLDGAGLSELTTLFAGRLGRPVLVYNADEVLLASAARSERCRGIVEQAAARGHRRDIAAALRAHAPTGPAVVLPPAPARGCPHRRLVAPMAIEGRTVGYLVVLETGGRFSPADVRLAEHGAALVTLALFHELREAAGGARARQDFVDDLLYGGRELSCLGPRARAHGVDLDRPHLVVWIEDAISPEQRDQLAVAVASDLGLPFVLGADAPGARVLLVEAPEQSDLAAARRVRDAVERALAGAEAPTAVISSICRVPTDYPDAARELRTTLALLGGSGRRGAIEVAAELAVFRLMAASAPSAPALETARRLVAPIDEADRAGHGDLLSTLRVLLAEDGQVRGTARRLGVHENTVRNRMAKVRSCSAFDPHRLDSLLDLRYCLQVLDLAGESTCTTQ